jgi:2-keto-4-pentenoate hydratase/2-oxohepta-3-ene-1,7-dioic acid hydratase in catechol pathway
VKLARFSEGGRTRLGVVLGTQIVDLAAAAPELPAELPELLAAGPAALARAAAAAAAHRQRLELAAVTLEAPVARPPKFLAAGLNYADHIAETGRAAPTFPLFFNKQSSCVNAPFAPIFLPPSGDYLDYEGELAFVIGRRCRRVPRARAHEVIGGYTIANDVSVRDWQAKAQTMTLGKSWDSHGPLGPWLVTADELGDPHALDLKTWVNGELRQNSNTKHLIFSCFECVEVLSTVFTLEPGDVILTGTPSGVALGMKPPRYLRAGDRVRIEISGIGHIEHEVVVDPHTGPQL